MARDPRMFTAGAAPRAVRGAVVVRDPQYGPMPKAMHGRLAGGHGGRWLSNTPPPPAPAGWEWLRDAWHTARQESTR